MCEMPNKISGKMVDSRDIVEFLLEEYPALWVDERYTALRIVGLLCVAAMTVILTESYGTSSRD